jgi:death on curing protein
LDFGFRRLQTRGLTLNYIFGELCALPQQIAEHGGLSDITILEGALARPRQLEAYGDPPPDIAALAAAYAFGIARTQTFVEGNKRTSAVVTRTFLLLNGHDVTADEATRLQIWEHLGEGTMSLARIS